tara:strand:- start:157 stop:1491 length:1335 start_codon:yes stop_codon:yes gene_type:complete
MLISNLIKQLESNYKIILFVILLAVFLKIFFFFDLYPIHDEVISFDRYLDWHRVFRKDVPNNHFLLSIVGTITKYLFGFNFYILRFISFLSLILICYFFVKTFKNIYLILTFFFVIFSSELIFNYSYLYRGYYLSSFISVLIFVELNFVYKLKNKENLRFIFFLCSLLFVHSIYTVYIILPILVVTFLNSLKIKKYLEYLKNFFIYFFIPTIIIIFLNIFVTGFTEKFSGNLNINFILNNFFLVIKDTFMPGFSAIFLNEYISYTNKNFSLSILFDTGLTLLKRDFTIFLIFVISLITSIIKIVKKNANIIDYVILAFFLFYFLINKEPFARVFVGIIYFFIFYIFSNIPDLNFLKKKYIKLTYFFIFIFALIYISPSIKFQQLKKEITKIDEKNLTCEEYNSYLNDYEVWVLINFYQDKCFYYWDGKKNLLSSSKINKLYKKR